MQKVERLSYCDRQFCIVRGIQLGGQDVLYRKPSTFAKKSLRGICNDENSSECDDENDGDEDTTTKDNAKT